MPAPKLMAQGLRNLPQSAQEDLAGYMNPPEYANKLANQLRETTGQADYSRWYESKNPADLAAAKEKFTQQAIDWNPASAAMTVWHGSPHKFDKFDMSKIGTGEGAQAYGHGLYMAESPSVATMYRDSLSDFDMLVAGKPYDNSNAMHRASLVFDEAKKSGESIESAIARHRRSIEDLDSRGKEWATELANEQRGTVEALLSGKMPQLELQSQGALYKTDIPDEAVARFLDWDKPLSEQGGVDAFAKLPEFARPLDAVEAQNVLGQRLHQRLANRLGEEGARQALNDAGIPGIRYLDGGSRGTGQGTSNFVLFDDQMPRILEVNGQSTGALPWSPNEWGGAAKQVPKTEFELAHEVAQRNAALPIEQGGLGLPPNNTAMDRAAALGYDASTFTGTRTPELVNETGYFIPGGREGSIRSGDAYGVGNYTTTSASEASAPVYTGENGAVYPLMINRNSHLNISNLSDADKVKLTDFAENSLLPSDKARFGVGRETREFKDVQDARDFFDNQRENWKQFGDGMDRARPEAIANNDGSFAVQFTNFDAPISINSSKDAQTLLNATGYDSLPAMGYKGHTIEKNGKQWDVTFDPSVMRSKFAAFDPMRRYEKDLLAGIGAGGVGYGIYGYKPEDEWK